MESTKKESYKRCSNILDSNEWIQGYGMELSPSPHTDIVFSFFGFANNFPNHASESLIPLKEKDLYDSAVPSRGSLLNRQSFGFVQNLKI